MGIKLTKEAIQKLTNESSFSRGEGYYREGRVTEYSDIDDMLEAVVVGSDKYRVEIDLTNLDSECNCPAFKGELFCKHQIAVLLTKIYGEVKTTVALKVKSNNLARKSIGQAQKTELKTRLESLKKEEIVENLLTLSNDHPVIGKYFTDRSKSHTDNDYKDLQRQIRQLFRGISYRYNWNSYVNKLDYVHNSILELVQFLPQDQKSCEFLLEQAYWIEEKQLTRLDDSDGIISGLSYSLVVNAVQYLNQKNASLDFVYKFTSRESAFDFSLNVIEAIYRFVDNEAILSKLGEKIEKTIYKTDSDFSFDNKWLHPLYLDYLEKRDYKKFLDIAHELSKNDFRIVLLLIRSKFKRKEYDEVIELGWGSLDHYEISDLVRESLKKTNQWKKYVDLLKEELKRHFSIKTLREIKQTNLKYLSEQDWEEVVNDCKQMNLCRANAIEFSLFLKDYEAVYKILTKNLPKDYMGRVETYDAEHYANKLKIIHPATAVKIYKFLIDKELERFKGNVNNYTRFFEYLDAIKEFGEKRYTEGIKEYVNVNFQNRKKLVEQINIT